MRAHDGPLAGHGVWGARYQVPRYELEFKVLVPYLVLLGRISLKSDEATMAKLTCPGYYSKMLQPCASDCFPPSLFSFDGGIAG